MEENKEDTRPDFMEWKKVREKRDEKIYEDFLKAAENGDNIFSFSKTFVEKNKNCCVQNIRIIIEKQRILKNNAK